MVRKKQLGFFVFGRFIPNLSIGILLVFSGVDHGVTPLPKLICSCVYTCAEIYSVVCAQIVCVHLRSKTGSLRLRSSLFIDLCSAPLWPQHLIRLSFVFVFTLCLCLRSVCVFIVFVFAERLCFYHSQHCVY